MKLTKENLEKKDYRIEEHTARYALHYMDPKYTSDIKDILFDLGEILYCRGDRRGHDLMEEIVFTAAKRGDADRDELYKRFKKAVTGIAPSRVPHDDALIRDHS